MSQSVRYPDRQSLPGSAARNAPLLVSHLTSLLSSLPDDSTVLEIASGEGHLINALAQAFPHLHFQATEADAALTDIISQRSTGANLNRPKVLEFEDDAAWDELRSTTPSPAAMLVVNVLHIVPWPTVQALWRQLGQFAASPTRVCVYGAFDEDGRRTSEGNERFNKDLQSRNSQYGLRDLQLQVVPLAKESGYGLESIDRLPAGNLLDQCVRIAVMDKDTTEFHRTRDSSSAVCYAKSRSIQSLLERGIRV